jgi:hypothetical protein
MTFAPIRPRSLLSHAQALAEHHSGAGRPLVAWLRRSVSASYYAVFHGVSLAVARQLAPSASDEERARLARSIGHEQVKEVCSWVSGRGQGKEHSRTIVAVLQANPDITRFAATFVRLQEARHEADYDHLADVHKATTLSYHQQAVASLDLLETFKGTHDGQLFLSLIALNVKLR